MRSATTAIGRPAYEWPTSTTSSRSPTASTTCCCVIVDADARVAHLEVGRAHLVTGLAEQRRDALPVPARRRRSRGRGRTAAAQKPRPSEPRSPSAPRFSFDFASSSADCERRVHRGEHEVLERLGILGVDRFLLDLDLGDLAGAGRLDDDGAAAGGSLDDLVLHLVLRLLHLLLHLLRLLRRAC